MKLVKPQSRPMPGERISMEVPRIPWYQTRKTKITGLITLVVLVAVFLTWLIAFRPYVSTNDARIDASIVGVANTGMSGQIQKVYVKEGDSVDEGTLLVELDHRTAEAQYERAKARAQFAVQEEKRTEALAAQHGTSQQQLDRVRSDADIAQADLKLAEINLEHTYLKSPVKGIVIQKIAEPGNILEANQTAVTVTDIEHAWVAANIEETSVRRIKPGQSVRVFIDEGGSLIGRVVEVRNAAGSVFALIPSDNSSGNFIKMVQRIPIKVELDPHPGRTLRVGQSVEIKIRTR